MKRDSAERTDVLVVGAGPAGATVAAELATVGHSVKLLDAGDTADRQELVNGRAADVLAYLGLAHVLEDEGAIPHHRLVVGGLEPRAAFTAASPRPAWYLPRRALRTRLLALAAERGVRRIPARATRALVEDGRVAGVAHRSLGAGSERQIRARVVVDASGSGAWLSRQGVAGARQLEGPGRLMLARVPVRVPPAKGDEDAHLLRGDALHWCRVLPVAVGRAEVCVAVPLSAWRRRSAEGDPLLPFARAIDSGIAALLEPGRRLADVEPSEVWTCRVTPFAGAGFVCVGDAHAVTDPVLGLGLGLALSESVRAAQAIHEVLEGDEAALDGYTAHAALGRAAAADLTAYLWRYPSFLAARIQGGMREDLERLVAGELYADPPLPALVHIRQSLRGGPSRGLAGSQAREIARRVRARYEDHQEVQAAFLEVNDDGALVSLVVDERSDGGDGLHEVEEALYEEFGRDHLAVVRWFGDDRRGLAPPDFDAEHVIFDRRAS